jgi:hypothetical protein
MPLEREQLAATGVMPEPDFSVHPAFRSLTRRNPLAKLASRLRNYRAPDFADEFAGVFERLALAETAVTLEEHLSEADRIVDDEIERITLLDASASDARDIHKLFSDNFKIEARRELYFALRRRKYSRRTLSSTANSLLTRLTEVGVAGIHLDPDRIAGLRSHIQEDIDRLNASPSASTGPGTGFDRGSLIDFDARPEFLRELLDVLRDACVDEAMNYYLGHDVGLHFVHLQISRPDDKWFTRMYEDINFHPRSRDIHFDSYNGIVKCILYLGDTGIDDGPFRYVPGSHRWQIPLVKRLAAKANPYANDLSSPAKRRAFLELPPSLRYYSHIGYNLRDEDPISESLREAEMSFTTAEHGHLLLFDNYGLHRGGQCNSGQRTCCQLVFTPVSDGVPGKYLYPF